MQPNDILLIGSDGRDDIILPDTGELNYDENLFLKTVEKANAELEAIYQLTLKIGEAKDDLSIMKIKFTGQSRERILPPDNSYILQLLKGKKFDEVVELLDGGSPEEKDESLL